jgi:hypothetical protein
MHFAIDEEPVVIPVKREDPPPSPPVIEQPKAPAGLLMESTPVKLLVHRKTMKESRSSSRMYIGSPAGSMSGTRS